MIQKETNKNVLLYKKSVVDDLRKSNVTVTTVASESSTGPGAYFIKDESKVKNGIFLK